MNIINIIKEIMKSHGYLTFPHDKVSLNSNKQKNDLKIFEIIMNKLNDSSMENNSKLYLYIPDCYKILSNEFSPKTDLNQKTLWFVARDICLDSEFILVLENKKNQEDKNEIIKERWKYYITKTLKNPFWMEKEKGFNETKFSSLAKTENVNEKLQSFDIKIDSYNKEEQYFLKLICRDLLEDVMFSEEMAEETQKGKTNLIKRRIKYYKTLQNK